MTPTKRIEASPTYQVKVGALSDLPAMVEIAGRKGEDPSKIGRILERVLREPYGFSVVVTARSDESERLMGFVNAAVLRPRFGHRLRCGAVPPRHLLANEQERFVASDAEVGRGNGDSGVDLLIVHYFEEPDLSPKLSERIMTLLVPGFVERYGGNKVRSVLMEVRGMEAARETEQGGYAVAATYDDWQARSGRPEAERPVLLASDRSLAVRHQNFHLVRLLDYEPPILRLPPAAREVVRCAYLGLTDTQIIVDLGLTPASLNSRWTRILDIAQARMPSLFTGCNRTRVRDRGPLLAYLRNHPEEMWPYEPPRKG